MLTETPTNNEEVNQSIKNVNYRNAGEVTVSMAGAVQINKMKLCNLQWVYEKIKSDKKGEEIVSAIRNEQDPEKRKLLKSSKLPYFVIGTFVDNERKNDKLISTEFMIFDFDHLDGDLAEKKEALKRDSRVFMAFTSPSGDGLKVVVRLETAVTNHIVFSGIYKHYAEKFSVVVGKGADKTSDAARACFFSFDPDAYLNENAVPLSVDIPLPPALQHEIVTSETTEELFNPVSGGMRTTRRSQLIGKLINKKHCLTDIRAILLQYNTRCNPPEDESVVMKQVTDMHKLYYKEDGEFWKCEFSSKTNKWHVEIDELKLLNFLETAGFGKIYYTTTNHLYVRAQDNVMDFSSISQMKDFTRKYIDERQDVSTEIKELLISALIRTVATTLFSSNRIEMIQNFTNKMKRDSSSTSFLYFQNCFVEIDKERSVTVREYTSLDGIIWKSQIINHDFTLATKNHSDYETFLKNVVRNDEPRFDSLRTAIGYLLHDYKNPAMAKAIVLNDEKISDNPNGRTGKSLIGRAIKTMRKSARIDGKNFEFERFAFQQVDQDTKIIDFNDVKANFEFEKLFSIVTDELTVEKKNHTAFNLKFDDSPKVLISTNYTIKGNGASFRARMYELEFSDFYNDKHTPIDDFGKLLFDAWDEEEWNVFYNFMIECILFYLRNGLIEKPNINLDKRKLIDATKLEFVAFMEEKSLGEGVVSCKSDVLREFTRFYSDYSDLRGNTFTKWLRGWGDYIGKEYNERRSNGKTMFWFGNSAKVQNTVQNLRLDCTPFYENLA